jgi:hypothetical protein
VVLLTSSLCSTSSLGTPGMLDGLHAKTSALSLRKLVREFLFGVEVGPDDDFLGCVGQAEANILDG